MPQGVPTPLDKAAQAIALHEQIGNAAEVARRLDMSRNTVLDIVSHKARWGEVIEDDPLFKQARAAQKRILQVASMELARKVLARAEEKAPEASFLQLVTGYGILRD